MTPRFRISLLLFLLVSQTGYAQSSGRIAGTIADAGSTALADVLVTLYSASDSAILQTAFTDEAGAFGFPELTPRTYFLVAEKAGFKAFRSDTLALTAAAPTAVLRAIVLQPSGPQAIDEVVVSAAVPFIQKKVDRTIVNPEALISNAGLTALEVLAKSPGVRVDAEGLISLLGRPGVVVFIDDRPSQLSALDLAAYLRSLPASAIQAFEIMTNPPAKYDAAGNAGVINIRLKKLTRKGFNGTGNLSYGQGIYPRFNSGVVVNYRINKLNVFSSLSYNHNNVFQDLTVKRRYYLPDGRLSSSFDQHTFIRRRPVGLNYRAGADYYINAKSTLGLVLSGFENRDMRSSENEARLYDAAGSLQSIVLTSNPAERRFRNVSLNLNYSYKFDDKGRELNANADLLQYNSRLDQSLPSRTYLSDGRFSAASNLVSGLPATITISTAKVDYIHPLSKGRVEAGAKASYVNTDNVAGFFDEQNGVLSVNHDFTNSFAYQEDIEAGYVNYNRDWNKLSAQLGLRYERTGIHGRQYGSAVKPDSSFVREFNNLFPTVYLQYKPDSGGNHRVSFSYGRRIDRPDYQSMNPFTYPLDRFTIYSGNPFLQPTFSNNFELAYNYKDIVNASLMFAYVKDVINETIAQGVNTFYSKPGNIGRQISYGLALDFGKPLTPWWTLQLHTELFYNINQAALYGQDLDNRGPWWYVGPVNQFTFPKNWSAELSGSYQSSIPTAQFIIIPVGSVNAAVSKRLFSERLTVKLAATDFLYTNRPGGEILGLGNSTASWRSRLDTRVVTLSLSYRLSKGKSPGDRKTGAADSERSRVR